MDTSTTEQSKMIMERHIDALNNRDRQAFADCFSEDALPHGLDMESFLAAEFSWFEAFPDLEYHTHELVGENEWVALRWTFSGTHDQQGGPGPIQGVAPTGQEIEVTGINIARVRDGKIVEYTGEWSVHELLDQIDIIDIPTD